VDSTREGIEKAIGRGCAEVTTANRPRMNCFCQNQSQFGASKRSKRGEERVMSKIFIANPFTGSGYETDFATLVSVVKGTCIVKPCRLRIDSSTWPQRKPDAED